MKSQFPADVLIKVFSKLSPYPLETNHEGTLIYNTHTQTLLSCALVNKHWSYVALVMLWKRIVIDSNKKAENLISLLAKNHALFKNDILRDCNSTLDIAYQCFNKSPCLNPALKVLDAGEIQPMNQIVPLKNSVVSLINHEFFIKKTYNKPVSTTPKTQLYMNYHLFVNSVDVWPSVYNCDPVNECALIILLKKFQNTSHLKICCHPSLSPNFFNQVFPLLPRLVWVDVCFNRNIRTLHLENLIRTRLRISKRNDMVIIGSHLLNKFRPVFINPILSAEGGEEDVEVDAFSSTINHYVLSIAVNPPSLVTQLVRNKKFLIWQSEITFQGLDENDQRLTSVLRKLDKLEEVIIYHDEFHSLYPPRGKLNTDSIELEKYFSCKLSQPMLQLIASYNLRVLDLRHNMVKITAPFLITIGTSCNTGNLKKLLLCTNLFSLSTPDIKVLIANDQCKTFLGSLEEFGMETWKRKNFIPRVLRGGRFSITFDDEGLTDLLNSLTSLSSLTLHFQKGQQLSSAALTKKVAENSLISLSLCGGTFVDDVLIDCLLSMYESKAFSVSLCHLELEGFEGLIFGHDKVLRLLPHLTGINSLILKDLFSPVEFLHVNFSENLHSKETAMVRRCSSSPTIEKQNSFEVLMKILVQTNERRKLEQLEIRQSFHGFEAAEIAEYRNDDVFNVFERLNSFKLYS